MIFTRITRWLGAHRGMAFSMVAVLVVVGGVLITWPILRTMETRQLSLAAEQGNELMQEAMTSSAIFTGEPEDAAARLTSIAEQSARLHDGLVLAHVYFATTAWRATIDYTEFTQRYSLKLAQVAQSLRNARIAVAQYDSAVTAFKMTNARERMEAAQAVNVTSAEARRQSELAYQDCVLVHTLTGQLAATTRRAELSLGSVGPDPSAAIAALLTRSETVAGEAHLVRKQFNPMAKPAFN